MEKNKEITFNVKITKQNGVLVLWLDDYCWYMDSIEEIESFISDRIDEEVDDKGFFDDEEEGDEK